MSWSVSSVRGDGGQLVRRAGHAGRSRRERTPGRLSETLTRGLCPTVSRTEAGRARLSTSPAGARVLNYLCAKFFFFLLLCSLTPFLLIMNYV